MTAFHLWSRQMFSRTCMIKNFKKIIRPDFLSQQNHCSNRAFSFPNETSPKEFVSKPNSCHCIMHPYCASFFTRYTRPRTRTEDFLFFLFCRAEKLSTHLNGFGDIPLIYLVCNRVESLKKVFSIQ